MLTCVPDGFCSWNYRVLGASRDARLEFDWLTEQGAIQFGDKRYNVVKHGWTSGRWTLERSEAPIAEGIKRNAFSRTMDVHADGVTVTVQPQLLSRRFSMEIDGQSVGSIAPTHPFTRRASIDCAPEVAEIVKLFAFWLVALMWRRAASQSAASPGGA